MANDRDSLLAKYQRMLADDALFKFALERHGDTVCASNGVSIPGLFALLDMLVDLLAECGLQSLKVVYVAVKKHACVQFEHCMTWQTCRLSGISARGCIKLADDLYVHRQHAKWVHCLWLCTHMREQERGRSSVPDADAAVYKAAMQCVLEQLHGAYAHVATHFKKNNVLACAGLHLESANDNQRGIL